MTSNVKNTGICHARFASGAVVCRNRRAHIAYSVEEFRDLPDDCKCKKCAAAVAKMGTKSKPILIDMTPTWRGVLPIYLAAVCDGSPEAARGAREELERMATLADAFNTTQRSAA